MANELMRRILHQPVYKDERGRFRVGQPDRPRLDAADEITRIRELITLLVSLDEADRKQVGLARLGGRFIRSGTIFRTATTYEDIFAICQQINYWMHGLSDNALTSPFLELLARKGRTIVGSRGKRARIVDIGLLACSAMEFIEAIVANALEATRAEGFDLLLELVRAPEIAQVDIVTLNHDTLVEQVLAQANIPIVDGFGTPDGDVRWQDDAQYDAATAHVRLIKLHGSIDWYRFYRNDRPVTAVLVRGESGSARDGSGTQLTAESLTPSFLTGGEKEAWYQRGTFADLHFRFHEALRRSDRIIMSGYGWGDTGITNQIDRWFDQRPDNKLVLLHEAPAESIVARSQILTASFDELIRRRQLIHIPRWMCNASLETIRPVLA